MWQQERQSSWGQKSERLNTIRWGREEWVTTEGQNRGFWEMNLLYSILAEWVCICENLLQNGLYSFFFSLKTDSSLIQYIWTTISSVSATTHLLSFPVPFSLVSFQKTADLQETTTKDYKTNTVKQGKNPSYWSWTRQPSRRKRVRRAGRRVRDSRTPTVRSST